jgi:hypothetical protein
VRVVADYAAVRDAVLSVRELLRHHITLTTEPVIGGVEVELGSPRELELANLTDVVSLWLHRIESQPDLLNRPAARPDPAHEIHTQTPLELILHVTPMSGDAATRLLLAGRIAQVLTDHRRLLGADLFGSLAGTDTVLLLGMQPVGSYELSLLWGTQHTYLRLGIGLHVQGVVIDSHLPTIASAPVLVATTDVEQIVGSRA